MSTQQTQPLQTMFGLHRSFVEQQYEITRDAIESQHRMLESMNSNIDAWRNVAEHNTEFLRSFSEQSFQAFEKQSPEGVTDVSEFEDLITEMIDQFATTSEESFELTEEAFEESSNAYEQFITAYLEALDQGFETYLEATDEMAAAADSVAETIDID